MPRKYENRQPARLSDILTAILKGKGWDTIAREYRVFGVWNEVVGPHIANNTLPKRIDRGVLFVIVRSSVWIQQLSLLKDEIIGNLNARLSEQIVRDIRFAQGEIPEDTKDLASRHTKERQGGSVEIDDYAQGVEDEQLREIIKRTLAKAFPEPEEE